MPHSAGLAAHLSHRKQRPCPHPHPYRQPRRDIQQIKEIKIKPEVLDPDDVEMLEDLIATCINNALKQVDDAQAASLGKYNIPGLM